MTSRYSPPPIIKAIERLLVDTELAVTTFVRKYRYELGGDIRRRTMQVFDYANRACRDSKRQAKWVDDLAWAVDQLRAQWQAAKRLEATRSFAQFEHMIRQVDAIGRQCGGWHRKLHPSAQNARDDVCAQCGQKLSTRAASTGANP